MYTKEELRQLITDTLEEYQGMFLASPAAVNLIMGTIAHESLMGKYRRQIKGPARGIIQMEPATEKDIWNNYLKYKLYLRAAITKHTMVIGPDPAQMENNDLYAIIMCRVHYLRVPEKLPPADDIRALALYWKQYYNTHLGKGTIKKFMNDYRKYLS